VATGGRAFWILDDVTPLREVDRTLSESRLRLYRPRAAYRSNLASPGPSEAGATAGQNPPTGALIAFYSPSSAAMTIDIRNGAGEVVRRFASAGEPDPSASVIDLRPGLNRITWDLRRPAIPTVLAGGGPGQGRIDGHLVAPGMYTVRLTQGGSTLTAPLEVRAMPGVTARAADYAAQETLLQDIEADLLEYRTLSRQAESVRSQLNDVMTKVTDSTTLGALRPFRDRVDVSAEPIRHLAYLQPRVNAVVPAVRASYREAYTMLHRDWLIQRSASRQVLGPDLDAINATLAKLNIPPIKPVVPPDRRGR
jgi:hypothetical protein